MSDSLSIEGRRPKSGHGAPAADSRSPEGGYQAVHKSIQARGVRIIDFWFTELSGRPWRLSMSADALTPAIFTNGIVVDGRQVGGSWEGLIAIIPDAAAAFGDPTTTTPTLSILCDIVRVSREAYPEDTRTVLRRAEAHFKTVQPGAVWGVGAEVEFFILDAAGEPARDGEVREVLRDIWAALNAADILVDWFRIGPAKGQGRVQMRASEAMATADRIVIYKNVVRSAAAKHGRTVRFLPKPTAGEGAAAMLVHHSIWRDGQNLFYDQDGWAHTSALCRWYAGGLLLHAPALLAFCAPTMNSYRRLISGMGPTRRILSTTRADAACRVPAGTTGPSPEGRRVKFCCADPTANPYLALSAMLMAGLDGIARRLEPDIDPADLGKDVPQSLEAALEALAADRGFLTAGGVFTDELIDGWIANRWREQVVPVRSVPHPVELRLDAHVG